LLGDLYTDAAMAEPALAAYQRLTKEFPEHPQAADAGYSSILALDSLAQTSKGDAQADWTSKHLEAQIDFAMIFADDPRATTVQASVADQLFKQGEYEDAMALARQLLASDAEVTPQVRDNARLIVGHSSMELENFVAAEAAYSQYLADAPSGTTASSEVRERLLASVYKQGEAAEALSDTNTALKHYLRIAQLGPGSEIAALAHYDAIAMMEGAKNATAVASLLGSFRDLYPKDPRATEVPGRLASMFEENKNYSGAAQEYLNVAASSSDPEQSRQAQYLAAELFLKDGDKRTALREFNNYAKAYEKPYDVNMAALDIQETLLEELGGSRVDLWRRKVDIHSRSGRKANERMNYLAAEASLQLADINRQEFDSLQLTQPLKSSLKAKQNSLKGTINAYKQVINYGVGDFVTAASYQIADMYVHLSRSIMDSSRPSGLSALELEQYEILLEEQAFPFEEQAIELHEVNLHRMWKGTTDEWTDRSLASLRVLMPGRFDKDEAQGSSSGSAENSARKSSAESNIAFAQLPSTRPNVTVKPQSQQWFDQSLAALAASDYVRAESLLTQITKFQPELSGPWLNLGQVYLAGERTDSARGAFERAIKANPTNCAAFNQLGVLARREGRLDEAENSYLACIDRDPSFPQVYLNLGILYEVYLGKLPQALKAYREYQELQASVGAEDARVKGWVIDLERRL